MKLWKPGLNFRDAPLIIHSVVPALLAADQIVVVGGFNFGELKDVVLGSNKISETHKTKIEFVENEEYAAGMFSSVQAGLSRVQDSIAGVYVLPGDMPLINATTYQHLAAVFNTEEEADIFVPALSIEPKEEEGGVQLKKGHPILARSRVFPRILKENRSSILRDVLKQFTAKVLAVRDPGICVDIDEESDLARLEQQIQHQ